MSPDPRPRPRGRSGAEAGQATVEFVLVLPVVVIMILAIVQVGVVSHHRLLLAHVAREAARAGATAPNVGAASAAGNAATGLDPDRLDYRLSGSRERGDRLVVTVRYRAPTTVPIVGLLLPDVELETSVTARVE